MNKRRVYIAAAASLALLLSLISFTRPNIDNAWLLIIFFIAYYASLFLGVFALGLFLRLSDKRVRTLAMVIASVTTAMQLLVTFQALRLIELVLITSVLIIAGWYVSKARG